MLTGLLLFRLTLLRRTTIVPLARHDAVLCAANP
jgi:hypothetical protein